MKKLMMLILIMFCTMLFSQFSGGDGTPEDPYQITTAAQLNSVRNYNGDPYSETYFLMMNDIDLSGYSPWTPMCSWFRGHFDGGEHTVTGLTIDLPNTDNVGLFEFLDNGEIKNLTIESAAVTGREYAGIICGYVFLGNISNCHSSGTVNGVNYLGGITGCFKEGNITECSFAGDLTGDLTYDWVAVIGAYISDGQYIGGITGEFISGTLSLCSASGSITGGMQLGGLTGQSAGVISNSYSTVNIFDETDYYTGTSYSESLGGLTGYNSGSVSDSYSAGYVEGRDYMTGGLTGYSSGTVSNCFWDINTSGRTDSAAGTGMTTAEMKTQSTFTDAGWDFVGEAVNGTDDIWSIDGSYNDGYPYLSWQYGPSGIEQDNSISECTLYQNYPNPFNPVTTINYALPKTSQVELNVYNLNGQLVNSLVNGKMGKGSHKIEFNGADLTSGMYVYNLKVDGKSVLSRKMMLLK